jgi:hypothetical protein
MILSRRARIVRWLIAAGFATPLWCVGVPVVAQEDVIPPSTEQDAETPPEEPPLQELQENQASPAETPPTDQEESVPEGTPGTEVPVPTGDAPPVDAPEKVVPEQSMIPLVSPDQPPAPSVESSAPSPGAPTPAPPGPPPPVAPAVTSWSFSLTTGYYRPRLGTLNRILQDTSVTILQDPNFLLPRNQNFPFEQRNLAVAGIEGGLTYGVDTFYNTGGPHSFGLSFSSWRGDTFGKDTVSLFLRSNRDPITVPRSARYNLVLDQIFLEWRYHLFRDEEGKGFYLNAGLVGITLAFFTMDSLVSVVDPDLSFASVSSDESFGWGYTTRFGMGGDYPITSWLSLGGRANYVLGNIQRLKVTRHFSAGFPQFPLPDPLQVRPGVPLPQLFFDPREGDVVSYTTVTTTGEIQENAGPRRDLALQLSGWEGLLELTVRF